MIYARDKSQMCNNLLQFAHVYAWGREHGRKVLSMRFSYKYPYFHIRHTRFTSFPLYLYAKAMAAVGLIPTASFKEADCDREALEQKMLRHGNIVVSGWHVRFYDLFLKYRDEICDLFRIDEAITAPADAAMQEAERDAGRPVVRLGVHIRRGDYRIFHAGKYLYDDEVYIRHINRFASMHPDSDVHVYLSTNDQQVSAADYQRQCPHVSVHRYGWGPAEDLHMLSACDYLIGPPSTFSLVAAMYRDVPLYRMDNASEQAMTPDAFLRFDYWFRHIV